MKWSVQRNVPEHSKGQQEDVVVAVVATKRNSEVVVEAKAKTKRNSEAKVATKRSGVKVVIERNIAAAEAKVVTRRNSEAAAGEKVEVVIKRSKVVIVAEIAMAIAGASKRWHPQNFIDICNLLENCVRCTEGATLNLLGALSHLSVKPVLSRLSLKRWQLFRKNAVITMISALHEYEGC